ncbi:MAG: hypothetical protein Q4B85_04870 [Lachnospiraceae bacterium]|nr:hypothetical protein [Lachnospiraceae bacterium]
MNKIWCRVNKKNMNRDKRIGLFLLMTVLLSALAGAIVWLAAGRLLLSGGWGLLCFVGYPAVFIGFFGGLLFLYNTTEMSTSL